MIDEKDIQQALTVLADAVNYIDKTTNCDDRNLKDPNGDTVAIALKTLAAAYREKCEECALWQKSEKECNEAHKKLSDELKEAHDLLWDVMCSGVTDPYPTCDYVEVQIDKETWQAIPAALKKEGVK